MDNLKNIYIVPPYDRLKVVFVPPDNSNIFGSNATSGNTSFFIGLVDGIVYHRSKIGFFTISSGSISFIN